MLHRTERLAVVGNPIDNIVHIFEQQGGNANTGPWEQLEETLAPPDDDSMSPYFGGSVGVNGNIILVGAPIGNLLKGSLYVYL